MASSSHGTVDLSPKIDFGILSAYADGKRDVPVNVAEKIDQKRNYVNTRYSRMRDYGLLTRVGPSDNSGLYAITPKGAAALKLKDQYRDPSVTDQEFEEVVEERAEDIEIRRAAIIDTTTGGELELPSPNES